MATFSVKVCNGCFVHCLSSNALRYNCLIFDLPCALISKQNLCVPLGFSASYRSLLFFRSLSIHLLGTTFASPAQTPARRTTVFGNIHIHNIHNKRTVYFIPNFSPSTCTFHNQCTLNNNIPQSPLSSTITYLKSSKYSSKVSVTRNTYEKQ